MHSTVYEISEHPIPANQQAALSYLPDWFYASVCDYTEKMTTSEREDSIRELEDCLGSQCSRTGNKLTFSPQFKQGYFKENFKYFKAAAKALAETEYDVFAGISPSAAFDMALNSMTESYADKHTFYVYCPERKELAPLDNWLRNIDVSKPFYLGGTINYHY